MGTQTDASRLEYPGVMSKADCFTHSYVVLVDSMSKIEHHQ